MPIDASRRVSRRFRRPVPSTKTTTTSTAAAITTSSATTKSLKPPKNAPQPPNPKIETLIPAPDESKSPSPLLSLPAELRHQILLHLLVNRRRCPPPSKPTTTTTPSSPSSSSSSNDSNLSSHKHNHNTRSKSKDSPTPKPPILHEYELTDILLLPANFLPSTSIRRSSSVVRLGLSSQLLRVCRQLHAEAGAVLYGENRFWAHDQNDIELFLGVVGKVNAATMGMSCSREDKKKGTGEEGGKNEKKKGRVKTYGELVMDRTGGFGVYGEFRDKKAEMMDWIGSMEGDDRDFFG